MTQLLGSVVVPAHDEERSVGDLLRALEPLADRLLVVVACNGCTDATVARAREAAPWATVLDLPEPSKPAALDAGDDAAGDAFPRLYLDADVQIDAASVERLLTAVGPDLPAAAATPEYDLSRSSASVRSHYRIWTRMAANTQGIAGTNAMAVTAQGRRRFDRWPRQIGDDYFLDGLFAAQEKRRIPQARVVRSAPRGAVDCASRKARIHQGNVDVLAAGARDHHGGGGLGAALAVVRREPARALDLPAHLGLTVAARLLSRWRRLRGTHHAWYRDASRAGS